MRWQCLLHKKPHRGPPHPKAVRGPITCALTSWICQIKTLCIITPTRRGSLVLKDTWIHGGRQLFAQSSCTISTNKMADMHRSVIVFVIWPDSTFSLLRTTKCSDQLYTCSTRILLRFILSITDYEHFDNQTSALDPSSTMERCTELTTRYRKCRPCE